MAVVAQANGFNNEGDAAISLQLIPLPKNCNLSTVLPRRLHFICQLMRYNQLTNERILSIDAFRGITILVMIFVNYVAGSRDFLSWIMHMQKDSDAMCFV